MKIASLLFLRVLSAMWLMIPFSWALAQEPCQCPDIQEQYSPDEKRYHAYEVIHELGIADSAGQNRKAAYQLLLSDVQLLAPCKRKLSGAVSHCDTLHVKIGPTSRNPILVSVDTAHFSVTNYSLPGHFLHPGKVARMIVEENGMLFIITRSEGIGRWPGIDERFAEKVWRKVDDRLKERM